MGKNLLLEDTRNERIIKGYIKKALPQYAQYWNVPIGDTPIYRRDMGVKPETPTMTFYKNYFLSAFDISRGKGPVKFIPGIARIAFDELGFLKTTDVSDNNILRLKNLVLFLSHSELGNQYDENLNGVDFVGLEDAVGSTMKQSNAANRERLSKMAVKGGDYQIVPIHSFEEACRYGNYTTWCVTYSKTNYDSYTAGGRRFYFLLKKDFENVEMPQNAAAEGAPLDAYGLSMISVLVDIDGEPAYVTTRWNHEHNGENNPDFRTAEDVQKVTGINFYKQLVPYSREELRAMGITPFEDIPEMLAQGLSLGEIFDNIEDVGLSDIRKVKLNKRYNLLYYPENRILLKRWMDRIDNFIEGLAGVKLSGKYGFIDKSGREVAPCRYDESHSFCEGFAGVKLNGKWGFIDKGGREVIPCRYDVVLSFSEGLAKVLLNGKLGYIDKKCNWYNKKPSNLQENTYLLSVEDIHRLINKSLKKYKEKKRKPKRVPSAQEQVGGKVNAGLLDGAYGLMEEEPDFYIGMEGNSNAEFAHVSQGSAGAPMNEEMVWQHGSTPHKEMTGFKPNIQPLIMYKQFKLKLDKDGKNMAPGYVFPLYVNTAESGNNGGLRVGAWYKSGEGECWLDTENGRLYTKGKGYGVDGNKIDKLAYRPGWHLTTTPWGNQRGDGKVIGGKKGTGNNYRNTRENEVWAKVEICVDVDATERARERSLDPKYQSLDKLNDREFYKYKTNANASDAQSWYIVDTIRIIDILDDDTVDNTNDAFYQDFLKQNPDKSINSDPEDYTQSSENEIPYWKMPRKSGKRYSGEDLRGMGYYSAEPTRIDESKKLTKDEYLESFKSIGNYMDKNGLKVKPFPKVKIDNSEQDGLFIKTGYYVPEKKLIVIFTKDRHPKDILRSFTHEMVHHAQNLRGDDLAFYENDDVKNNERLEKIESEAYLKGNIYFRKWTEYFKNGEEKELLNESIKKSDIDFRSFKIQDKLNPKFWKDDKLDSKIRLSLLKIADDFIKWVGVKFKHSDITITGSLANYTWNKKYSDIDLHILVDFSKFKGGKAFAKEFFSAKKSLWNEKHEKMKILGYPVEIYVQDTAEFHKSNGIYSLEKDSWIKEPDKETLSKGKIDKKNVKDAVINYADDIDDIERAFKEAKSEYELRQIEKDAEKILSDIRNERKSGFKNNDSEINDGNVIFKTLRRLGYIGKIIDLIDDIYDKKAGFEI